MCHVAQCQPVHERHSDVCDQQIRFCPPDPCKRQLPVSRFPCKLKSVLLPGDIVPESLAHHALIFRQKYFPHASLFRFFNASFASILNSRRRPFSTAGPADTGRHSPA